MNRILSLIDRSSRLAETLAVILVFGYCGLMLAEVVARAQAKSFSFSWEYSQYAMAAVLALAAGPAIRTGVHVRITLVGGLLPKRAAKWLDVVANGAALVIAGALLLAVWDKFQSSWVRDIPAATVTQTPLWIPQAFLVVGIGQFWLDLFARFIRRVTNQPYEWRDQDTLHGDDHA